MNIKCNFTLLLLKIEFQKIVHLLDTTCDDKDLPRFISKKWIQVYDQSGKTYIVNKEILIKAPILISDLCDFNDVYIVVKGTITVTDPDNAKRNKAVAFKNNAPFINCISKINGIEIGNAEDLDVVIPMYNLLEYSKNYRKTRGSLWNYYRDEPSNPLSLILNRLITRQVLQKILMILMLVMLVMMQPKSVKMKLNFLFH